MSLVCSEMFRYCGLFARRCGEVSGDSRLCAVLEGHLVVRCASAAAGGGRHTPHRASQEDLIRMTALRRGYLSQLKDGHLAYEP